MLTEDTPSLALSLSLPRPISLLSLAALCPEDSQSQETQSTDLTDTLNTMSDGIMGAIDEFLTFGSGFKDLLKEITNIFEAKPKNPAS